MEWSQHNQRRSKRISTQLCSRLAAALWMLDLPIDSQSENDKARRERSSGGTVKGAMSGVNEIKG